MPYEEIYTKPATGIPKSDMAADVQVSLGKADTAIQEHQSLAAYRTASDQDIIDLGITTDIDAIEEKIPSQASSENQLADKLFVNSSIATNTATFRGTSAPNLTEAQFLTWANSLTKTNNDYVFWDTVDEIQNKIFKRYKYNGSAWIYEYTLNNSSFTAAQWAAINSGLTSTYKDKIDTIETGAQVNVLTDVKIGNTSVVTDKVATIPIGTSSTAGVLQPDGTTIKVTNGQISAKVTDVTKNGVSVLDSNGVAILPESGLVDDVTMDGMSVVTNKIAVLTTDAALASAKQTSGIGYTSGDTVHKIASSYLNTENSLTSTSTSDPLAAKQGKILNESKVDKTTTINGYALSSDVSLDYEDVSALSEDTTHLSGDVPITRTINSKALSSNVVLYGQDIKVFNETSTTIDNALDNKVPITRTINGYELSSNVELDYDDVNALSDTTTHLSGDVPITTTVNGKALSTNISLVGTDIAVSAVDATKVDAALGAKVPKTREINGHTLENDIDLTAADVGALSDTTTHLSGDVPTSRKINNYPLTSDITLSKSDVGLGNVGNFKAVSTVADQELTTQEKTNARTNIGAGIGDGSVTSVSVSMNGSTKGTVTTSGTIDLGTVITEHQSLSAYRTASAQDVIDLSLTMYITGIDDKIPEEASSSNQLADKAFVNSSISTNTSTFRGTSAPGLTEQEFLTWANTLTKTNNDYVFWNTVDEAQNVVYKRYKYNGTSWIYEYSLNNSSFTAAQWASINSGLTSASKTKLDGIESGAEVNNVTDVQIDGVSILTNKIANIDTSGFGKVDDVKVNGSSVVTSKVANVTVPTKVSDLSNDAGYTTNTGTVTSIGITMNGSSKGTVTTSGAIDLGTVITDVGGKEDKTNKVTNWSATPTDTNYPSEKLTKDSLDAKQATLVSGTNIKTINSQSLLGSGNIELVTDVNWGDIGGTLSDQDDLQEALDAKASSVHTHTKSQITDFPTLATVATSGSYNDLSDKPQFSDKEDKANKVTSWSTTTDNTHYPSEKLVKDSLDAKAAASHTHTKSEITDFPTNVSSFVNDAGYTTNTGTVTSVGIQMNGSSKGTVTTSGTIDLGTVITEHQSLSAYRTSSAQDVIDAAMASDITAIEEKIPSAATSSNQLADKDFVNSSISTNTATFRGTSAIGLTEEQFLAWANTLTKTKNDYVFWNTIDSNNNPIYKRYKYNGTEWVYEYSLNNSSFTAAQWNSINSGMSATDKTKLDGIAEGATANTGTVTSVAVKMNGETKGTITTNGEIDLGTVITSHQDISGKQDASTAVKHTESTAVGSTTQPIYVDSTGVATAIGYTIEKSVPSNAEFTDTTYSAATTSADGLMSSTDKIKLDGIATGATNVTSSTVTDWGFTKNTGTITGIIMNGDSKGTSGVVDLGTVITSHQSLDGYVPIARTINTKALSTDITLTASDVGALPSDTTHLSGDVPTSRTINGQALSSDVTTMVSLTRAQYDALPSSKLTDGKTYYITDDNTYIERSIIELTQAQYDALPSSKESDGNMYVITDGNVGCEAEIVNYDNTTSGLESTNVQDALDELAESSGGAEAIHLTQAEYDALPDTKLTDNKIYCITDASNVTGAQYVPYSHTISGLAATNVQSAIDEVVSEKVDKTQTINSKALSGNITLYGTDIALSSDNATTLGNVAGLTYTVVSSW